MGPVPLLVGCLVVGVAAGRWLDPPWWITAAPGAAALVAGVLLTRKGNRASWWLLLLASLLLGGFLGRRAGSGKPHGLARGPPATAIIGGRALGDEVDRRGSGVLHVRVTAAWSGSQDQPAEAAFLDALDGRDPSCRILLVVREGTCGAREGDRVWIRGAQVIDDSGHRNPGVAGGKGRGRRAPVLVALPGNVLVSRKPRPSLAGLRTLLAGRQRSMLSPVVAGFASAVTTGRAECVHPVVRDAFRRSGTAHLLAVSGLHLSMVAWIVFAVVCRVVSRARWIVERIPAQHVAAALALGAAWFFAAFASGRPPVLRAALMVTAATLARFGGRQASPAASLSLAAGVLVLADPSSLFSPSFVLSFTAVTGIFLVAPRIGRAIEGWLARGADARDGPPGLLRTVARVFAAVVSVSLAASMATLPAVAFFFGDVPLAGPLVNVAAVPLFSILFLPVALFHAVLCLTVPAAAALAAPLVEAAAWPVLQVVSLASRIPGLRVAGALAFLAALCASASLVFLVTRRRAISAALACACAALVIAQGPARRWGSSWWIGDRLAIVFLDVGMGDAAFVRTPAGERLLVDAGPAHPHSAGDAPLPAFVRAWDAGPIDRVYLSHPHADHFGGLSDLLAAGVAVREVVLGVPEDDPEPDPGFHELLASLRRRGTRVLPPPSCGPLHVRGLEVEKVHPCGPDDPSLGVNDRSMVLALGHGRFCFLMTGDIGGAVEGRVASRVRGPCRFLKVPHHGSRRSSTPPLLEIPGPGWAAVGARRGNRHGLPHPEAIERLVGAGLAVHRIDLDGALVVIAGSTIRFHDWRGRRKWHGPCYHHDL